MKILLNGIILLLLLLNCGRNRSYAQKTRDIQDGEGVKPGIGVDIRYLDPLNWEKAATVSGNASVIFQQTNVDKQSLDKAKPVFIEPETFYVNSAFDFEKNILQADSLNYYSSQSSNAYNQIIDNARKNDFLYVYTSLKNPVYKLSLKGSVINETFKDAVNRLGRDITSEGFVSNFGTHYLTEVTYGGHFLIRHIISKNDFVNSPYNKTEFKEALKIAIEGLQTTGINPDPYIKLGNPQYFTIGGDENLIWYNDWKTSVVKNSQAIDASTNRISVLLTQQNFPEIDSISAKRVLLDKTIDQILEQTLSAQHDSVSSDFYQKYSLEFRQTAISIIKKSTGKDNKNNTPYVGDIFIGAFTQNNDVIQTAPIIEKGGVDTESLITDEEVLLNKMLDILVSPENLKGSFVSVWDDTKKLVKSEERTTLMITGTEEAKTYFKDALNQKIEKEIQIETIDKDIFQIKYSLEKLEKQSKLALPNTDYNYVMDSELVSAASVGDIEKLKQLYAQGGNRTAVGVLRAVIQNQNDPDIINAILDEGVKPTDSDLELAFDPDYFTRETALILLERGAKPKNNMIYKAVAYREPDVIYALLREGAIPVNNDLEFATSLNDYKLVKSLLSRDYDDFTAGEKELALAVENGDMEMIDQFIKYGAKADASILKSAAEKNEKELLDKIVTVTAPSPKALEVAALVDNKDLFDYFIKQNAKLESNKAVEIAIDNDNMNILDLALKNGGEPTEALNYAIEKKRSEAVKFSLENKAKPEKAFQFAADTNDNDLFEKLLTNYGGKPEAALQAAVNTNNDELVEYILDKDFEINIPENQVKKAVDNQNLKMVKLLVGKGGDPNQGLQSAVAKENLDITTYLLKNGATVKDSETLVSAVKNRNDELVNLLLDLGKADPNQALEEAIEVDEPQIIQKLIEKGAQANNELVTKAIEIASEEVALALLNKTEQVDPSLLSKASRNGMTQVIKELLRKGIDPQSGLLPAILYKQTDVVRQLLVAGVEPDFRMLKNAINYHFTDGVIAILNSGIIKKLEDDNGNTPLHLIAVNYKPDDLRMADIFIEQGANVNAKNQNGETPLHLAVRGGIPNLPLIEKLINQGGLVEAKTYDNKTVIDYTRDKDVRSLIKDSEVN